jgi:ribokinase
VVTDGRDGAYVSAPTGILHCPALAVKIAGTAGAGDAFNATFAANIAEGASAEHAAMAASANAASVLGHIDTQTGLLQRTELERRTAVLRSELKVTRWAL